MDLFQAEILAECTEEEMKQLEEDQEFQLHLKQEMILEEYELLEKHKDAMNTAISKGNTTAIQWKLERINPKKWARKEDPSGRSPFEDEKLVINLVGRGNGS